MVAGRNFAADVFCETIERDPFHTDREKTEFLAAESGHRTDRPFPPRDPTCDPAQNDIPGVMAISVIDRFETVNIDDK